ncbi:MAG: aminomethyl-transferring glycine dehydrogenase subunit GcvPB [Bacillota bacterium]|jgi:glycine dehydrogenase subunit 2|nr:aminomethyl-transferring glycine dehydrogenase subunit GcvPB [Clostridia bacterium]
MKEKALIFEISKPGRVAYSLPPCDVPEKQPEDLIPRELLRTDSPNLPEVSEIDAVRHFTQLSQRNHGVDSGFYPLGSCTMKYNPKVNEYVSRLDGFTKVHPYQPEEMVQGSLELMYRMDQMLSEITGMERVTLQPAAGAHGEMTGLMIIKAYHENRGDSKRTKMVIPDAAHGTNPASAAMTGFDVIEVKSNSRGGVDVDALKGLMSDEIAGLMLTNPNTLGLFEENILEIAEIIHQAGGLLYYDGANANAIMGITRPGDMGFDVVHLNLHKTFSTPHGGGGPGSGPVGVKKDLVPFLPKPVVEYKDGRYFLDYERPLSIGRVKSFYGNFNVVVKAFAYIMSMGKTGLREVSEAAVLNANYIAAKLKDLYLLPYDRICMHECVLSGQRQKNKGVATLDIAKRLLDFGYHPPTVYFPLIVHEALMIEPTESESRETLDEFIAVMRQIAAEAETDPEIVKSAPHNTVVSRLDEAGAARNPVLRWKP